MKEGRELSPELRALLFGEPFGEVYPQRPNPPPLAVDGRTAALRILRQYFSELIFQRAMGVDPATDKDLPPKQFRFPINDIHISWPDYEKALVFPSIVMLAGTGNFEPLGLGTYWNEETRDKYGKGTIVQYQADYVEEFTVEIWAAKRPELRAILAGIQVALSPTETMYGIRFRVPEYFDQLVCFTPGSSTIVEESPDAQNRRKARITIEMRMNQVALVNYDILTPTVEIVTDGLGADLGGVTVNPDYLENRADTQAPCVPEDPCGPCDEEN